MGTNFCTRQLKQEMAEEYYKTLDEDYILYFGYGIEEWRRVQKQTARFMQIGRTAKYPIFESKIRNDEIKRIIQEDRSDKNRTTSSNSNKRTVYKIKLFRLSI